LLPKLKCVEAIHTCITVSNSTAQQLTEQENNNKTDINKRRKRAQHKGIVIQASKAVDSNDQCEQNNAINKIKTRFRPNGTTVLARRAV